MRSWHDIHGAPYPQGVTYLSEKDSYNFSLYASDANKVRLLLYGDNTDKPLKEIELDPLLHRTQRIWHIRIDKKDIEDAKYYGYRVWGPITEDEGFHAYDPEKVLLDPYAHNVFLPESHSRDAASEPGDNEGKAPLGVLPKRFSDPVKINGAQKDHELIVYEMHVKQFTANENSGVPHAHRGTFKGVIDKIPYLKELGVTAVELMPVQQWDPLEGSAWGYMTLNFFSPHRDYSSDKSLYGHIEEFKELADALHAADLLLIMDVVYNHTTETDKDGPTYSFRGIDNNAYYLESAEGGDYANFSGTGNTFRSAHPQARGLILDSLRFWVLEMGVDGFRFDLGSIFALNSEGEYEPGFYSVIDQISHDPALQGILIFTEPWDGDFDEQGYLLGKSFPGLNWKQWNDKGRETFRRFVKGDRGMVGPLMTRMYGSADFFPGPENDLKLSHTPSQSLNYISSHDGMTMYDLVSYTKADQRSWNCGFTGVLNVPDKVMTLRKKQVRNFITLLMLSNGTPLFRAGEEFLQTQLGKSNPYNVDNETVWLDWKRKEDFDDVFQYFKSIIAFRKAHPSIARGRYWQEDVHWFGPNGQYDVGEESHTLAYFLRGNNKQLDLYDDDIYVMINSYWEPVTFDIMEPGSWRLKFDTAKEWPENVLNQVKGDIYSRYEVAARGIAIFLK